MTYSISVELISCSCGDCGITYAIPTIIADLREKKGECTYCPLCGKEQFFVDDEPKKKAGPTLEERQRLIKAMHDAEQAEAKAAEVAENVKPKAARKSGGKRGES